jgi:iron complex outermembrane receptor protein
MVGVKFSMSGAGALAIVVAAATAHADQTIGSLRMRSHGSDKRVAQAPISDPPNEDSITPGDPLSATPQVAQSPTIAVTPALPALDLEPIHRGAVLVTGSLIERASRTTPSAVTVLTRDDLLASGRSMIGDILQPLPEQANAINAQINNGGDGSTRFDLRGLGATHTLVLLDGRRFVPVGIGADATVDLNTIPLATIERVEVLKDAASAVYGSDAVGGVVNIITRSKLSGTEVSLYTAETERRDGFTFDASFITGHRSDSGRGHLVFSAGVQRQDPVLAADRPFSEFDKDFNYTTRTEARGGSPTTPAGRINQRQFDIDGDGKFDTINLCGATVTFCVPDGRGGYRPFASDDLYNFQPPNYLYTPSSRFNAYSAGTFELGPDLAGFFQMSFLHRESSQQLAPEPLSVVPPISRDSIYNPFGAGVFGYARRAVEFGPRGATQGVNTFRLVTGVKGSVPDDIPALDHWNWELSFNLGRTDATINDKGHLILSRLRNALGPSFINASGVPTCGTPLAPIPGCVPMNILAPAPSIDDASRNYVAFTGVSAGLDQEQMVLATTHGRLATFPHGDISLAIATDFRRETGSVTPDALITAGDTTGVITPTTKGSTQTFEAMAELQVVAVRDRSGLERLEVDLAARQFRIDDAITGTAWNARALLRPIPGLTLRATTALAFRAPTVAELFRGNANIFAAAIDPCDHAFRTPGAAVSFSLSSPTSDECAREGVPPDARFGTTQQRVVTHGNQKLDPETARVTTSGAVLELFRGLALSVDLWRIDVDHAIRQLTAPQIFTSCYERGMRALCGLIHRDPARNFAIDFIDAPTLNLGTTSTAGLDAAVDLTRDTGGLGQLRARFDAQRLFKFDLDDTLRVAHGLGNYDLGVYPDLKANLSASWQHATGLSAGFNVTFVGSFLECLNNNCNGGAPSRDVASWRKVDVFSTFTTRRMKLTVGVNNVFDTPPPTIYIGFQADSDAATYNYLGRFVYTRLTQSF